MAWVSAAFELIGDSRTSEMCSPVQVAFSPLVSGFEVEHVLFIGPFSH